MRTKDRNPFFEAAKIAGLGTSLYIWSASAGVVLWSVGGVFLLDRAIRRVAAHRVSVRRLEGAVAPKEIDLPRAA